LRKRTEALVFPWSMEQNQVKEARSLLQFTQRVLPTMTFPNKMSFASTVLRQTGIGIINHLDPK
jgi:hypothetical protein